MKNNHMVPFMLYQQHSSKTRPACLWWRLVWHLVQLLSFSSWLLGYWSLLLCTDSFLWSSLDIQSMRTVLSYWKKKHYVSTDLGTKRQHKTPVQKCSPQPKNPNPQTQEWMAKYLCLTIFLIHNFRMLDRMKV